MKGGSYFFTLVTDHRRKILVGDDTLDVLREAFRQVMSKRPFSIDAIVVLPDHIHCIWTLPSDDQDFSIRWRLIKTWFTKHCHSDLRSIPERSRIRKQQQNIWQHRYWEHKLKSADDYRRHVEYIHYNPVKHGYVLKPIDWQFSSFQRYVLDGVYPSGWGESECKFPDDVGNE